MPHCTSSSPGRAPPPLDFSRSLACAWVLAPRAPTPVVTRALPPPVRVPLTVEKETPDACAPCDGTHGNCHSASPALDPVREHVRNALKATVFYKKQINPLRAIMGYN